MRKILSFLALTFLLASCDTGGSSNSSSSYTDDNGYYDNEPEYIEQVVTRYCTTCGGTGQVMTAYGPSNCPGCTAYGRPAQYQETVMVPNPNYRGSNPSFRGNPSAKCNIRSHSCTGFVDKDGNNYCDVCAANGYDQCHKGRH
jgi:hypothetical protein